MDKEVSLKERIEKLYESGYVNEFNYLENQLQEARYLVAVLQEQTEEKGKEIERLKNGYCELKVKCNNGECDCTNEEYDGMVQCNMKLSLENDELRNILEKMGTNPNEILYLKNEVDELNNIINELEKWLESEYKRYLDDEEDIISSNVEVIHYKRDLNKLKELKEESYNGKDNESTSK